MSFLQQILGGGQGQQDYQDFLQRYDDGPPWTRISDDEAIDRYSRVAPQLPPDMYQDSAYDALSRLSPQERLQIGQYLQQKARQRNINLPAFGQGGMEQQFQDSGVLAQMLGGLQQQQPDLLTQVLGGALGGGRSSLDRNQDEGGMLDSPLAKAALAGITAMAVKRLMSR